MHWITSGGADGRLEKSKAAKAGLITSRMATKIAAIFVLFRRDHWYDIVSLQMRRDGDTIVYANLSIDNVKKRRRIYFGVEGERDPKEIVVLLRG
jgi:uncharacterized protein with ACT and thioredoxin-like domain